MIHKKKWAIAGLRFVIFVLLVAAFFDSTYRWTNFENYSENLVSGRVYAESNGYPINSKYGLGRVIVQDSPCNNDYSAYYQYPALYQETDPYLLRQAAESFSPYTSQIGLQGHIFGLLARILQFSKAWLLFRIGNIAALILVLMLISHQLVKQYGILMGISFLGVSVLSPWVRNFAPNLYWVEFTWFLPMLFGLLCLTKPNNRVVWYLLYFLSVLIKCLCGFEYLSTILVGGVLFLAVEWIAVPSERKRLFGQLVLLVTLSILAFLTVYIMTAYIVYSDQSLKDALISFWQFKAAKRLQGTDPKDIATTVSTLKVVALYFWENLSGKAMLLLTVCAAGTLFFRKWKYGEQDLRQRALFTLSLLGAISWFALAKQHSYVHLHLNFVIWFIGTVQIQCWIILDALWHHRDLLQSSVIRSCNDAR